MFTMMKKGMLFDPLHIIAGFVLILAGVLTIFGMANLGVFVGVLDC